MKKWAYLTGLSNKIFALVFLTGKRCLSDECAKNFVTADSDGKGRWLEGPVEWHGQVIPERLEALGLSDKWMVKFAGSADALWAELAAAQKEGRGTVIFNWTPNFTDYEGFTMIEFPPFYPRL
jgi:glycine betaine/proline transport system substrate-binding protein